MKKKWLKTALYLCTIYLCTMASATFVSTVGFTQYSSQNWANSPQNWQNSLNNWENNPQNWENSPQNWKNSPQNWENNPNNYGSINGIYDSDGNRIGYVVPKANGGVNYFNNNGARRAYQPGN
jgi:hypothetical protein